MKSLIIGVTGHRVLTNPEKCRQAVVNILASILKKAHKNWTGPKVVLSPLAEGADRLVARECLKFPDFALECPLPLEADEYLKDFKTEESQREFMDLLSCSKKTRIMENQQTRAAAYKRAGHYVVDHCELLLAIWDGRPPENEAGTAGIVHYARSVGKPLYWIDSEDPEKITTERIDHVFGE